LTTYSAITDSEVDPESPITTSLVTKLRDNPLAIQEGDSTAPKVARFSGLIYLGASGQSIPHNALTTISWSAAYYQDKTFWSAVNPTRILVPSGVTRVQITAQTWWPTSPALRTIRTRIVMDGAGFPGGPNVQYVDTASSMTSAKQNLTSAIVACTSSNYFEVEVFHDQLTTSTSAVLQGSSTGSVTWVSILEIL